MTKAWHLRKDGKAFPVKVHMYCMQDEDLSSEAEAASFILSSDSDDQDIAKLVLDAWMALLIENEVSYDAEEEDIEDTIREVLSSLPYKFQYPISTEQLLDIHRDAKNYHDVDTLYEFIDNVRARLKDIQEEISLALNDQFCRVRYGGQYNSVVGDSEIWFRVSSKGYNWANVIYEFATSLKRKYRLSHITICRDHESDNGFDAEASEYFYKAKDGALYKHMPIDEFFEEEHEHSLVFDSVDYGAGVLHAVWRLLESGMTYRKVLKELKRRDIEYSRDLTKYLIKKERAMYCVAEGMGGRHRK